MDTLLNNIYYNPKEGFIGAKALFEKAKLINPNIKPSYVNKWLSKQSINQIHRDNTKKIAYLPIFSNTPGSFQIDLSFIPKFKTVNRGYEVILTCININTRVGYAYALKKKSDTYEALQQFIKEATPMTITSDNGSEFINIKTKKLFKDHNIEYYQSEPGDKHKMGKVERFNRTIKERLNRYFTAYGKPIWYDILDQVVENYNNTRHSSIGQTPYSVTPQDEERIIASEMLKTQAILRARNKSNRVLSVGDKVRLPLKKKIFDKGEPRYTSKLYTIKAINEFGNSIEVEGKKELYKYEDVQLNQGIEQQPVNRDFIEQVAKEHKVARQLRDLNIDQGNVRQGKREKIVVQRLDV